MNVVDTMHTALFWDSFSFSLWVAFLEGGCILHSSCYGRFKHIILLCLQESSLAFGVFVLGGDWL